MAHLTQHECDIIEQNPLGDSLDAIREVLREVDASHSDDSADVPARPRLFVAAIAKLLKSLSASEVSLSLDSRTGRELLASDLLFVLTRLQKGEILYEHCRPLSELVVQKASDVEIWGSVIILVQAVSHCTPPPSLPSFETPITHSSASQQGSEQTRRAIEHRVFEEIRHCTHRAVEGFHKKYFEDNKWSQRAKQIWQRARSHYSETNKSWMHLPDTATKDEVCGWWLNLQQELLASERAAYYRSSQDKKVGINAQRQLDLLVKFKKGEAADEWHDWKDVLVVGELKRSDKKDKALWLQVGSAVRNVFAHQPRRLFVHAFTLTGTEMETWIFDRSGPYSGATFDIHKEPEKFIQVMCGYLMMRDDELGLESVTQEKNGALFISMPTVEREKKRRFELDPDPIALQRAIVCRGTSCFLAKAVGTTEFNTVIKFSWPSNMRPPESTLLNKAVERGVKGLAKVVGYMDEVSSISSLRDGLNFAAPHKFRSGSGITNTSLSLSQPHSSHSLDKLSGLSVTSNTVRKRKSVGGESSTSKRSRSDSPFPGADRSEDVVTYFVQEPNGTSLVQHDQTPYANRIFRILAISPAGRSISQFESVVKMLECLHDAIKAHQSLLSKGKILHRDISENNIIITDPAKANGFSGMLIDLDLAKEEGTGPSGARHRTGTMEFMAIEVLLGYSHTYRHDLEAIFYVLIWLCARRAWKLSREPGKQPRKSMLLNWYTGDYQEIAHAKVSHMTKTEHLGFRLILKEFPPEFDCVKPLCWELRDILFLCEDEFFVGTPKDSDMLYEPMLRAFKKAIAQAKAVVE